VLAGTLQEEHWKERDPPLTDLDRTTTVLLTSGDVKLEVKRARVLIESGSAEGAEVLLPDRPFVIGRGSDCDLILQDSAISRRHVCIRPRGTGYEIEDLGSKAGTRIAGLRIEKAELLPGTEFLLGTTRLVFEHAISDIVVPPRKKNLVGLLGESPAMKQLFGLIERVAALDLPVLLIGESGTGKEALARALHDLSSYSRAAYEVVDCTLLNSDHLRSELFGHIKGAFTGAQAARMGAFELADQGSVFLDEVGELPLEMQPTLLRVLEEGEVRPLGAQGSRKVKNRIVSATNRDLRDMAEAGTFRQDLYYRLSAITIEIPPLGFPVCRHIWGHFRSSARSESGFHILRTGIA
jgi:hypothetical protein